MTRRKKKATHYLMEAVERDAVRYRWLREQQYNENVDLRFMDCNEDGPTDTWYSRYGAELDAEIDEWIERGEQS